MRDARRAWCSSMSASSPRDLGIVGRGDEVAGESDRLGRQVDVPPYPSLKDEVEHPWHRPSRAPNRREASTSMASSRPRRDALARATSRNLRHATATSHAFRSRVGSSRQVSSARIRPPARHPRPTRSRLRARRRLRSPRARAPAAATRSLGDRGRSGEKRSNLEPLVDRFAAGPGTADSSPASWTARSQVLLLRRAARLLLAVTAPGRPPLSDVSTTR
jgi:hypothetical protein